MNDPTAKSKQLVEFMTLLQSLTFLKVRD